MKKILLPITFLLAMISCVCYAQNNVNAVYQMPQTVKALPAKALSLPQIMIRLCEISYITDKTEKRRITGDSIKSQVGWELVWGPFELTDIFGVTYSSMFVAKDPDNEDYAVVIRGTNPTSLKSWLGEDFEIHKSVGFSRFVPGAPGNAKISEGTCKGLDDLIKLKGPDNNTNVVSFLKLANKIKKIRKLYVTGHSLGGTLTPPFYTYLCYKIFGGPVPADVTACPYSFAGLTAGNQGFNDFIKPYINANNQPWRYVNPNDIAPKLWESLDALKNIYAAKGLHFGSPESEFMDYLFDRAKDNNYMQPPGSEFTLPAVFNPCETIWLFQALYQHHYTTYISLVDSLFAQKK